MTTFYAPRVSLVCLAAGILGCGGGTPRTDENGRAVVEWVVRTGGTAEINGRSQPITRINEIPEGPVGVRSIDLTGRDVEDGDLERLVGLASLSELLLYQTAVTDAGLVSIAELRSLRTLNLSYTRITDEGLGKLASLRNLRRLFLRQTPVTDEGVEALEHSISVEVLR